MKRKTTTIIEEYNEDGKLVSKTTETTEEEGESSVYPLYPLVTVVPTYTHTAPNWKPEWVYRPGEVTCKTTL